MGLLPMPRNPIISTCAGTDDDPANWASECIRPIVSVMPYDAGPAAMLSGCSVRPVPPPDATELGREVDRILAKIYREGEVSLTAQERQTLETASREYQQRRK